MGPKVLLRDENIFSGEDPLLEIAFDDRPQGFYRIEFRSVRRHEHEFDVLEFRFFFDCYCDVGSCVVEDHCESLLFVLESFPQQD